MVSSHNKNKTKPSDNSIDYSIEDFIKDNGVDMKDYSQEEIEWLYTVTFPFANFAMKKWNDTKARTF